MAITTKQQLYSALKAARPFQVTKQRNQNIGAGQWSWTWSNNSFPVAGSNPASTTPVVLSSASTGAIPFTNPPAGQRAYLAEWSGSLNGAINNCFELHDYLAHMNGLVYNVTTPQTIPGFDLLTLGGTSNLAERYGATNYADVTWWHVTYTQAGDEAITAAINVTYHDGTTGDLATYPTGSRTRAGRLIPINSYIPAADSGKYIRGINSITLSAPTAATGNFGFTATRNIANGRGYKQLTNHIWEWSETGLERIYNDSCLSILTTMATNNQMFARMTGKIVYG